MMQNIIPPQYFNVDNTSNHLPFKATTDFIFASSI
jgi:hypothetical protein